jgi:hypothetical protein
VDHQHSVLDQRLCVAHVRRSLFGGSLGIHVFHYDTVLRVHSSTCLLIGVELYSWEITLWKSLARALSGIHFISFCIGL